MHVLRGTPATLPAGEVASASGNCWRPYVMVHGLILSMQCFFKVPLPCLIRRWSLRARMSCCWCSIDFRLSPTIPSIQLSLNVLFNIFYYLSLKDSSPYKFFSPTIPPTHSLYTNYHPFLNHIHFTFKQYFDRTRAVFVWWTVQMFIGGRLYGSDELKKIESHYTRINYILQLDFRYINCF